MRREPPTRRSRWAPPLAFAAVLLMLWEAGVRIAEADPRLFPPPSAVALVLLTEAPLLARHTSITAAEMLLGFAIGATIGFPVGIVLAAFALARRALYPWLVASQAVPIPAIASLLVLWFGFTLVPKLVVVALITFFPIAVGTVDGLRRVDPDYRRLMATLGADRYQVFLHVALPSALPSIFSGARIAATLSVLGAVFGEWVGARGGLGYLLLLENRALDTDAVLAIITLLAVLGVGFFSLVTGIERRVIPWHGYPGR